MEIKVTKYFTELIPDEGMVIVNKNKTERYEYSVYLGYNDSVDNYVEITAEEADNILPTERSD